MTIAVTCAIVRGELQYGIVRLPDGPKRGKYTARVTQILRALHCLPVTEQASDRYAEIRRAVELAATPLDDNDLWIAATALSLGAILVTRDSDFSRITGLVIEDWSRPV
jgi:tRNA(fMet)-specific endonuclease VapC